MKKIIVFLLSKLNLVINKKTNLEATINQNKLKIRSPQDYTNLFLLNSMEELLFASKSILSSKSQIKQDLFVISTLKFKQGGYFVEFGATNGIDLSNTYLLEKDFNWTGILVEPGKIWHNELIKNRACVIEKLCVWKTSGNLLEFNEVASPELSTIEEYNNCDIHSKEREIGLKYVVESISLLDLLKKNNAPKRIDYLSIDTEGSEFTILSNFDFSEYSFDIITCEHNYSSNREKIYDLLTSQGYVRVFKEISQYDDWYVNKLILP